MTLERRALGSSGFRVSVMGFGTGGFSRAGLGSGEQHAADLVAHALTSGIDLIDTGEEYGTERVVADGLASAHIDPASVTIATKYMTTVAGRVRSPAELRRAVRERLVALGGERLDVLQAHAVLPQQYRAVRDTHLPVLEALRDEGWITSIGITEAFTSDPSHDMLDAALADGCWDTVMVGYNLLNPRAVARIIGPAAAGGVGVLAMFAVRQALADFQRLRTYLRTNTAMSAADIDDRVRRLERHVADEGGTLTDLAYRFVASTPGVSTVLVGTGDPLHFARNRAALERERLSPDRLTDLQVLFADVPSLTGQMSTTLPR